MPFSGRVAPDKPFVVGLAGGEWAWAWCWVGSGGGGGVALSCRG